MYLAYTYTVYVYICMMYSWWISSSNLSAVASAQKTLTRSQSVYTLGMGQKGGYPHHWMVNTLYNGLKSVVQVFYFDPLRLGPRRIRGLGPWRALIFPQDLFGWTPLKGDVSDVLWRSLKMISIPIHNFCICGNLETWAVCELEATWPTESGRIRQQTGWATENIPRIKPQFCEKKSKGFGRRAIINQWVFCTSVGHRKFESLANHQEGSVSRSVRLLRLGLKKDHWTIFEMNWLEISTAQLFLGIPALSGPEVWINDQSFLSP